MSARFPGEPVGAEAALVYHLLKADYFDFQETLAEAQGYDGSGDRQKATEHKARFADLEAEFPLLAEAARAQVQSIYEAKADES